MNLATDVVALHLLQSAPERFDRAALIATGDRLMGHRPYTFAGVLPALLEVLDRTGYPSDLPKHLSTHWNILAATAGDRQALRASAQASYAPLSATDAAAITIPTLVISGQGDRVLGQGRYVEVPGADHFSLAADPDVKAAVARFMRPTAAECWRPHHATNRSVTAQQRRRLTVVLSD